MEPIEERSTAVTSSATRKKGATRRRSRTVMQPSFHHCMISKATGSVTTMDLLNRPAANSSRARL